MHDQPRMKPLRRNDFFEDAREGRPLVAGTVYRNQTNIAGTFAGGPFMEDVYSLTGMEAPNRPGNRLPFPLTADVLRRGQERFNIYCSPCHSRIGDGNGMIVQRGYRHPPSYHTDTLRNSPLGHFFDVMTNGFGAMPDYAQQVAPGDRWAIAAYIRALQLSQNATVNDVPADVRNDIAKAPSTITAAPPTSTLGETPSQPGMAGERNQGNEATPPVPNPQMTTPQPRQQQPAQPRPQATPQGATPR